MLSSCRAAGCTADQGCPGPEFSTAAGGFIQSNIRVYIATEPESLMDLLEQGFQADNVAADRTCKLSNLQSLLIEVAGRHNSNSAATLMLGCGNSSY